MKYKINKNLMKLAFLISAIGLINICSCNHAFSSVLGKTGKFGVLDSQIQTIGDALLLKASLEKEKPSGNLSIKLQNIDASSDIVAKRAEDVGLALAEISKTVDELQHRLNNCQETNTCQREKLKLTKAATIARHFSDSLSPLVNMSPQSTQSEAFYWNNPNNSLSYKDLDYPLPVFVEPAKRDIIAFLQEQKQGKLFDYLNLRRMSGLIALKAEYIQLKHEGALSNDIVKNSIIKDLEQEFLELYNIALYISAKALHGNTFLVFPNSDHTVRSSYARQFTIAMQKFIQSNQDFFQGDLGSFERESKAYRERMRKKHRAHKLTIKLPVKKDTTIESIRNCSQNVNKILPKDTSVVISNRSTAYLSSKLNYHSKTYNSNFNRIAWGWRKDSLVKEIDKICNRSTVGFSWNVISCIKETEYEERFPVVTQACFNRYEKLAKQATKHKQNKEVSYKAGQNFKPQKSKVITRAITARKNHKKAPAIEERGLFGHDETLGGGE